MYIFNVVILLFCFVCSIFALLFWCSFVSTSRWGSFLLDFRNLNTGFPLQLQNWLHEKSMLKFLNDSCKYFCFSDVSNFNYSVFFLLYIPRIANFNIHPTLHISCYCNLLLAFEILEKILSNIIY